VTALVVAAKIIAWLLLWFLISLPLTVGLMVPKGE
jgi:hypothetical protein